MKEKKRTYKPKERNKILLNKFYEETKKEIETRRNIK